VPIGSAIRFRVLDCCCSPQQENIKLDKILFWDAVMKLKFIALFALSIFVFPGALVAAENTDCDRSCLNDLLQQYMDAVTLNDLDSAPVIIGFRQTENAVVTRAGTGVWQSVTALGAVQRQFLDPVTGQAAYFGIVQEGDKPVIVTVRLKVVNRQITEAEWYIGRDTDPGAQGPEDSNHYDPAYLVANPPPAARNVPSSQRLSRESLVGVTNSYFDGITTHDGSIILAKPGCQRVENGRKTTGRVLDAGSNDGFEGFSDCTTGMSLARVGNFGIALVSNRRYELIDEQQQVVLGSGVFVRNPNSHMRRNGVSEFFYIDDNLISQIYAAMYYPDPNMPMPNWPPYDGNFPLPATFGEAR
jgi:hypothetical protein